MALIHCSECGKEISDKASACPNCGCPVEVPKQQEFKGKSEAIIIENVNGIDKKKLAIIIIDVCLILFLVIFIGIRMHKKQEEENNRYYVSDGVYMGMPKDEFVDAMKERGIQLDHYTYVSGDYIINVRENELAKEYFRNQDGNGTLDWVDYYFDYEQGLVTVCYWLGDISEDRWSVYSYEEIQDCFGLNTVKKEMVSGAWSYGDDAVRANIVAEIDYDQTDKFGCVTFYIVGMNQQRSWYYKNQYE